MIITVWLHPCIFEVVWQSKQIAVTKSDEYVLPGMFTTAWLSYCLSGMVVALIVSRDYVVPVLTALKRYGVRINYHEHAYMLTLVVILICIHITLPKLGAGVKRPSNLPVM
jgi:hypothetical protein